MQKRIEPPTNLIEAILMNGKKSKSGRKMIYCKAIVGLEEISNNP